MKKINFFDRIKHLFGIHKYGYIIRLSESSHLVECIICKKRFSMNTSVKCLLEWDQELQDMHVRMGHIKEETLKIWPNNHEYMGEHGLNQP